MKELYYIRIFKINQEKNIIFILFLIHVKLNYFHFVIVKYFLVYNINLNLYFDTKTTNLKYIYIHFSSFIIITFCLTIQKNKNIHTQVYSSFIKKS